MWLNSLYVDLKLSGLYIDPSSKRGGPQAKKLIDYIGRELSSSKLFTD